jgi:hypothetical protein
MSDPRTSAATCVALSVKQPWAELIMVGRKSIEVRTWTTDHRGPLYIHTGQNPALHFLGLFPEVDTGFRGGFLGMVDLIAIEPLSQTTWSRLRPEHLVPGPMPEAAYGWRLANPRRLESPVRWSGALGLFPVPAVVVAAQLLK